MGHLDIPDSSPRFSCDGLEKRTHRHRKPYPFREYPAAVAEPILLSLFLLAQGLAHYSTQQG